MKHVCNMFMKQEGGWSLWPGGNRGLYRAGGRDLALEGERLRKGLEMKMTLIFKTIQIYLRTFPELCNSIYIYQPDKSSTFEQTSHSSDHIFMTSRATWFQWCMTYKSGRKCPEKQQKWDRSLLKCSSFTSSLGRRRNGLWLDDGQVETQKKGTRGKLCCFCHWALPLWFGS